MTRAIDSGAVHAGIVIPPGFAQRSREGDAQVLVLVDGSRHRLIRRRETYEDLVRAETEIPA